MSVEPEWIPRTENQIADFISHIQDFDDWQLHPSVFCWLNSRWGLCTVDRFASFYNTQLPRFNSRFCNPRSEAVDCFTCDWTGEMNWWCLPVYLIPRLLRHAQNCKCRGIIVLPRWSSAPFWPLICPDSSHLASFVRDWCDLPLFDHLFLPGRCTSGFFSGSTSTTCVLGLLFDFNMPVGGSLLFS